MKDRKIMRKDQIPPADGKLGVLMPGLGGAVSTTFIAGVELVRRGLAEPIGSLSQLGTIRLGKRFEQRTPLIKDFVPLVGLDDLVFGGWDLYEANGFEAAMYARVLSRDHLESIKGFLGAIVPMRAVFDRRFVRNLDGTHVKPGSNLRDHVEALKEDIQEFKKANGVDRCVMIWCGSTEVYQDPAEFHQSPESFLEAVDRNEPRISPSMLYALA
ncbi:MAG: inositol-3-phosphate synthase, partial [Syntrophobacteraceae bacterium]|nr:inositol-3-phosphate synthase [Syntrophobacteraceae bacterium]